MIRSLVTPRVLCRKTPPLWKVSFLCSALLLSACGEDDSDANANPDGGGTIDASSVDANATLDAGADAGLPPELYPSDCFEGTVEVQDTGELRLGITEHYRLESQLDTERTEALARLLEAAWPQYARFFGQEPTLGETERLRVRLFRDAPAYRAGLAEDGITGVGGSGGYYEPSNRTAYLFDQPTQYYTQTLLLHEAGHQFHGTAIVLPRGLPFWYIEGTAEYISRHDWDGRCIRLGIQPLITQEDDPAEALEELTDGSPTLQDILTDSVAGTRPVARSLFRYLNHSANGALAADFRQMRDDIHEGVDPAAAFRTHLGPPSSHDEAWLEFLRTDQEPMQTVFLEHVHIGPTSLLAFSDFFSIAVLKAPVERFQASFAKPDTGGWSGGVVLGYESRSRYEALVVRENGRLQRFDVTESARWNDVGPAPAARDGRYAFEVNYRPGFVTVTINDEAFEFETALPFVSGVAVDSGELLFEGINWN